MDNYKKSDSETDIEIGNMVRLNSDCAIYRVRDIRLGSKVEMEYQLQRGKHGMIIDWVKREHFTAIREE